jgi:hypothetical protein
MKLLTKKHALALLLASGAVASASLLGVAGCGQSSTTPLVGPWYTRPLAGPWYTPAGAQGVDRLQQRFTRPEESHPRG